MTATGQLASHPKLFDLQSGNPTKRSARSRCGRLKESWWRDGARPIIFYNRFAYCWQPQVKGWTMMVNSIVNNWRTEDVWLDK